MAEVEDLFVLGEPCVSGRRAALMVQSALLVAMPGKVARRDLQGFMDARNTKATLDVAMNEARRWFAERGLAVELDPRSGRYEVRIVDSVDGGETFLEEVDAHRRRVRRAVAGYKRSGHTKHEVFSGLLDLSHVRSGAVFPPGSSMHALYARHRFGPLTKLLDGISPVTTSPPASPDAGANRPGTASNSGFRWTIAAVEGGADTVRIYSSAPGEEKPLIEEFPGSANASFEAPLRSTHQALQLLAERAGTSRHDRVVCVVALSGLMRHNGEQISLQVKDMIFDCGLRGAFFIVNDSIPPLLPTLAGLEHTTHANVSVKVGAGSVVTALVPGASPGAKDIMRFGGADHLFTDQGSGFQMALQAFRTSLAELYDVAFGDRPEASRLALEAARFVERRTGAISTDGDGAPDINEAIRSIQTASARWSSDLGMKRRVSAFTRVVCDLADENEPNARQLVRKSAAQLGHLTALAAQHVGERPVVEVVGRIPYSCTTYRHAFGRSVREELAGRCPEPEIVHRAESIETAHRFAVHLHEHYVATTHGPVLRGVEFPNLAGYLHVVQ